MKKYFYPLVILVLVLVLGIMWFFWTAVPRSTDRLVGRYLHQQKDITAFTITQRQWVLRCCAQSKFIQMRKANIVRYSVTVTRSSGKPETLVIDLEVPGYEGIDDFDFLSGHHRWKISNVYQQGITPPNLTYVI